MRIEAASSNLQDSDACVQVVYEGLTASSAPDVPQLLFCNISHDFEGEDEHTQNPGAELSRRTRALRRLLLGGRVDAPLRTIAHTTVTGSFIKSRECKGTMWIPGKDACKSSVFASMALFDNVGAYRVISIEEHSDDEKEQIEFVKEKVGRIASECSDRAPSLAFVFTNLTHGRTTLEGLQGVLGTATVIGGGCAAVRVFCDGAESDSVAGIALIWLGPEYFVDVVDSIGHKPNDEYEGSLEIEAAGSGSRAAASLSGSKKYGSKKLKNFRSGGTVRDLFRAQVVTKSHIEQGEYIIDEIDGRVAGKVYEEMIHPDRSAESIWNMLMRSSDDATLAKNLETLSDENRREILSLISESTKLYHKAQVKSVNLDFFKWAELLRLPSTHCESLRHDVLAQNGEPIHRDDELLKEVRGCAFVAQEIFQDTFDENGARAYLAEFAVVPCDIKGEARLRAKVMSKKRSNPSYSFCSVKDICRASLVYNSADDLLKGIQKLKSTPPEKLRVVGIRNSFSKPTALGYADVKIFVRFPSGHIGELQLHLKEYYTVKEHAHELYKEARESIAGLTYRELTSIADCLRMHSCAPELYSDLLSGKNLLGVSTFLPLGVKEEGCTHWRVLHPKTVCPLTKRLHLFGHAPEGATISLMHTSRQDQIDIPRHHCGELVEDIHTNEIVGIFIVFCAGNALALDTDMHHAGTSLENAVRNTDAPLLGVCTVGEIVKVDSKRIAMANLSACAIALKRSRTIQSYAQRKCIPGIMENISAEVLRARPADPYSFIAKYCRAMAENQS